MIPVHLYSLGYCNMNHKEAFFKKAQHNQEEVVSIEQKTKLDIKTFQDCMAALARQIET